MLYRPGDVIGFSSCGCAGLAINVCSLGLPFWDLSHVGLVGWHPEKPSLLVYESTGLINTPCAVTGQVINGVQGHRLHSRIRSYRGHVWHYPLALPLPDWHARLMSQWCIRHLGRDYDEMGAFRVRDTPLGWLRRRLFGEEDLRAMFCSEFVAAGLRYVGKFQTDNASHWNPNALCRRLRARGIVSKPRRVK